MQLRAAVARDAEACRGIYAPHLAGPVTFEEELPSAAEMSARIGAAHAWLVAEHDGDIVGYAYAGGHRTRPAYRWTTEVAAYVAPAAQRRGVARALYVALLEELRTRRLRLVLAGITLPNGASVAFHEALGFTPVGVYRNVGYKAGAWRDVGWWQLDLGEPAGGGDQGGAGARGGLRRR